MSCLTGLLQKLRKPKLFDIALFDLIGTLLGAFLAHRYFDMKQSLVAVMFAFVIIGIAVHVLLGVPTMLNYYLGLSEKPMR